jgi:hypothetical protein
MADMTDPAQPRELSPAEVTAAREGLPVAVLTLHDLLMVARGHPLITDTVDGGGEVLVRLYTADELTAAQQRATARLQEDLAGWEPPPPMTRAEADNLTRPLRGRIHDVTVTSQPHGSIPFIFAAACSCGAWRCPPNAWKWTALAVQDHLTDVGMMRDGPGNGRVLA